MLDSFRPVAGSVLIFCPSGYQNKLDRKIVKYGGVDKIFQEDVRESIELFETPSAASLAYSF